MKNSKLVGISIGLFTMLSVTWLTVLARNAGEEDPKAGKAMPAKGTTLLIELGLKDSEATGWAGAISVSEGTVTGVHVARGGDNGQGNQWKGKSQVAKKKKKANVSPLQVHATLDAPAGAMVTVSTRRGDFTFKLGDLPPQSGSLFLDDQVRVSRGPLSVQLTDQPTDDDFPAAAVAPDGTVWVAFVAYQHGQSIDLPKDSTSPDDWSTLVTKGHGDQVRLFKFDGKTWSAAINVTEPGLDVWRPSVAVDGSGKVSVAWSQNFDGNWDVASRRFDPHTMQWDQVRRLTRAGADINPVLTTDSSGTVWMAIQAWQENPAPSFDILVARQADGPSGWSEPMAVGSSAANEWNPAITADRKGNVFVAYDSYEKGNYDVRLAVLSRGAARAARNFAIADSAKFEARAAIAVDNQDRLWVAYEEADANWGKDFGSKWTGKSGVPFYLDRRIRVRVVNGEQLEQPKGEVPSSLTDTQYPGGRRVRLSMPRLACDGAGRMWLLYRRHPLDTGAGEVWNSFATFHAGDAWSPAMQIPKSENFIDNRPALVRLQTGSLAAVHSTDSRSGSTQSGRDNDLFVCVLDGDSTPQDSALAAVPPPPDGEKDDPVHPNEEAEIKRMRDFRVRAGGKTYQLLRGEFHRHTEMTSHRDQDGPFEEIWRYGLDVAKMDWIGQGDHDNGQREYPWWLSQKQDDIYFHAPTFMPMFTYERSVVYPSGHRNVMFATRGIRPLPRLGGDGTQFGSAEEGSPDIKRLYAYLKHFDGICSMHTSATGMGTDWRDNDPVVEPVVEIYQGHRQNYEYEGAPQSATAGDTIGRYEPAGFVWNAWRKGYRLGIQVSSDHVSTHLSYGVVLAEKPTRQAIVDAFKKRHCYGAQDNIILIVRSGEYLMGDEFTVTSPPQFEVQAMGTAPIARVAIIRGVGGEVPTYVYNSEPNQETVRFTWRDDMAVAGETSYYYVRIEQADQKLAWASPMWITFKK